MVDGSRAGILTVGRLRTCSRRESSEGTGPRYGAPTPGDRHVGRSTQSGFLLVCSHKLPQVEDGACADQADVGLRALLERDLSGFEADQLDRTSVRRSTVAREASTWVACSDGAGLNGVAGATSSRNGRAQPSTTPKTNAAVATPTAATIPRASGPTLKCLPGFCAHSETVVLPAVIGDSTQRRSAIPRVIKPNARTSRDRRI